MGLSFTIAAGSRQRSHSWIRVPRDSEPYFTVSDSRPPNLEGQVHVFMSSRNRVAQFYPQTVCSFFVASWDSQGYSGGIRTSLHTPQSQSHIAIDGQSIRKSWGQAPSGAYDQIFVTLWQLRSLFFWGALSDERMGLSFVYAAGPRQRSLDHILLSQILDFPYRRLLRLAGSRSRYSNRPPHGCHTSH
jgi:hypothetical protein